MLDANPELPDLRLLVGPGDDATLLGGCVHADARGRAVPCLIYVAVHRRGAAWTHVYRAVRDARPGHLTVFNQKALPRRGRAVWSRVSRPKFAAAESRWLGVLFLRPP